MFYGGLRQLGLVLSCAALLAACDGAEVAGAPDEVAGAGSGGSSVTTASGGDGGSASPQGGGGAAPEATDEASLITWNLESFPLTASAPAQAVALLTELAPDVVALQEIADEDAFDDLVASLDGYAGVMNDDPGAYIRVGLLWRTDRVTVSDVETLFPDDWYAFPRPPLKAHVTIDGTTPVDFVTVVLHLKAQLDAESEARRRAGCEALDAWVRAEQSAGAEQDYVLVGDLNDKVTDPPQWNVFGAFLDRPETYRFLTLPAADAGEHTYIPFESFIDHVIVTTDALDEIGTGQTEVLALENDIADYRDLTDHRPVRTWLSWGN